MYTWNVFLDPADIDSITPKILIGTITADSMAEALDKAAQYFEIPSHDLVVERRQS